MVTRLQPANDIHPISRIGPYVLGRLSATDTNNVRIHIERCGGCRQEVAEFTGLAELLEAARLAFAPDVAIFEPPATADASTGVDRAVYTGSDVRVAAEAATASSMIMPKPVESDRSPSFERWNRHRVAIVGSIAAALVAIGIAIFVLIG